ncbi:aspartyl/asparaginyl beta-hydroxylase domain-containing protein [Sorangium sp. So ce216]
MQSQIPNDGLHALVPRVEALLARFRDGDPTSLVRLERCIATALGRLPIPELPPGQKPAKFFYPGLSSKPWHDPADSPALAALTGTLEASWREILAEYDRAAGDAFEPYEPGRFAEVKAKDWKSVFVLRKAEGLDRMRADLFPHTSRVLREAGIHPKAEVLFSVIAPGVHVPAHHDAYVNTKLTCQLALRIPEACGIRVGGVEGKWTEGKCVIFDTTFAHEVWNHDAAPRVVLFFDIWHPDLSAREREAILAIEDLLVSAGVLGAPPPFVTPPRASAAPAPAPPDDRASAGTGGGRSR